MDDGICGTNLDRTSIAGMLSSPKARAVSMAVSIEKPKASFCKSMWRAKTSIKIQASKKAKAQIYVTSQIGDFIEIIVVTNIIRIIMLIV